MSIINISLVGLVGAQSYKADILVSHIPEADSGVAKLSGRVGGGNMNPWEIWTL